MLNETLTKIEFIDLPAQRHKINDRLAHAIRNVLEHGAYILGPEVHALESALSDYIGDVETITCANGTDALKLVLLAKGIGPGDAVFVPTFTFASTAEVVAESKATPVFVDICPITYNMHPDSLELAIEKIKQTSLTPRGIIAVDLFGHPANYPALQKIADTHAIWLLADAAQSFGGQIHNKKVGNLTEITTTSFFPSKPLAGYGDGGAIFTRNPATAKLLRSLRNHGSGAHRYEHLHIGLNSRLDTLQAAILLEKLNIFPEENQRRQEIATQYHHLLADKVIVPETAPDIHHAWGLYTVICQEEQRDFLTDALPKHGIPCNVYYRQPLHHQPAYAHYPRATESLSVAEKLSRCVLSLPMHPYLTNTQVDYIARTLRELL